MFASRRSRGATLLPDDLVQRAVHVSLLLQEQLSAEERCAASRLVRTMPVREAEFLRTLRDPLPGFAVSLRTYRHTCGVPGETAAIVLGMTAGALTRSMPRRCRCYRRTPRPPRSGTR